MSNGINDYLGGRGSRGEDDFRLSNFRPDSRVSRGGYSAVGYLYGRRLL